MTLPLPAGLLLKGKRRLIASLPPLQPILAAALTLGALACASAVSSSLVHAQTAPAPAASRQIGTVKSISASKLTIATDAGLAISVNVADGARVLQLAPGSTDLKSAEVIALGDIEIGDRVLVSGHQDAPDAFTAARVILMKATDLAQKHQAEQQDWQKRGTGGLVTSIDRSAGVIAISSRGRQVTVQTTSSTVFRRYSEGSVKYEDASAGDLGQIQAGDQLRVRGARSDRDAPGQPSSIAAEEVVSGSFKNLAGTIVSVDLPSATLTLKDLATKKTYSIKVTSASSVHVLPPEAATRFAARAKSGNSGEDSAETHRPPASSATAGNAHTGAPSNSEVGSAGNDLSLLVSRLPPATIDQLHPGNAVMVVASQSQSGSDSVTAITLLSGVEPILAATPTGGASMTLSPWNFGAQEGGGGL